MENKVTCLNAEDHERRIAKLEGQYDELKEQFYEQDKRSEVAFTKVTAALENLADLPKTMNDITTTMVAMKDSIHDNGVKTDELANTVKNLSSKVSQMDDRDRFSMLEFLKKNWPMIVAVVLFAGYAVAEAASRLLG